MAVKQQFSLEVINPLVDGKVASWEDKIRENKGELSGYLPDLNQGKPLDSILLSILQIQPEGTSSYPNYLNVRGIYLEHIKSSQEDLGQDDSTKKQEINTLESNSPSMQTVNILKKYGILMGIEFLIPYEKIYKPYDDFMGENVSQGSKNLYKNYWDQVISAKDYIPTKGFVYKDLKLSVQVLIYSRAKSKLIDITNFISHVTTNVNIGSGGNFSISMNLASKEEIDSESNFQDNNLNITGYKKALYLQSIFRENDLVFIRFEKLNNEGKIDKITNQGEFISASDIINEKFGSKIKGKFWDIIGLIDVTSINSSADDISISISGRDLIKLFIEDYNFFIPVQFGNTKETIFGGGGSKIFKRLFTSGEYNLEFTKSFRSIENSIGFILSQLTNTQIVSSDCIDFLKKEYQNDLSKQFQYTQSGKEEKQAVINGIWGLVNYYVDDSITQYRQADASLRSPEGSVLQQIQKVCEEPFVEIIADTFVDKYSLYLRKPPFSLEDISKQKFIIVGREDTISEDLNFEQVVHTVYQLIPQGACFVNNNSIPLAYLPMVVLDEYTKLWGCKLYSQVYNYIDINSYTKITEKNDKGSKIKESFVDALIWLIETNAYLPFSRKGNIVIRGDRRIKIGQWIYFEKSNEVFYVEGVQHTINISGGNVDRKTVLQVSRGLVKDYITPNQIYSKTSLGDKTSIRKNVSYADLVDLEYLQKGLKELFVNINKDFKLQKLDNNYQTTDSIVNKEVFDFFLSGEQFENGTKTYISYYKDQPAITLSEIKVLQQNNV